MSKTLGQRLDDFNIEVGTAMTIDWQQVRIQASIEIAGRATFTFDKLGNIPDDDFAVCAKRAVQMADALITELKKGGDNGKSN